MDRTLAGNGARRRVRPARRRIPPLQRGRGVDRAALREDVVRQLGAAPRVSATRTRCSAPTSTREVARGIVRWVREVASEPEAGYAASQDADVGLEDDGDYFTWTRDEAAAVLGPGGAGGRRRVLRHRHRGRDAPQPGEERPLRRHHRGRAGHAAAEEPRTPSALCSTPLAEKLKPRETSDPLRSSTAPDTPRGTR